MAKDQIEGGIETLNDEELDLASGGLALTNDFSSVTLSNLDIKANVQRFVNNQTTLAAHLVMMLHPTDLASVSLTNLAGLQAGLLR
jgi:hypothetical protein